MSKFSFTSPDGQTFEVLGPANATFEQARAIFDQQFKSGGLTGLRPGDVVNATVQAAAGLRSALSQVGIKLPSSVDQAFEQLQKVPLVNPISAADFIKQAAPNFSLGPLTSSNLQGLMAQTAAQVNKPLDQVSAATGIGKFGINLPKLELTGFIKPGTADAYAKSSPPTVTQKDIQEAAKLNQGGGNITAEQVANNRKLNEFLTPAAFTNKNGVGDLQTLLKNESVQNVIQQTGLQESYDRLVRTGTTVGLAVDKVGGLLQAADQFSVKTATDWAKGLDIKNIGDVNITAKAGEYATNLINKLGSGAQTQVANITGTIGQIANVSSVGDLAKLAGPLSGNISSIAGEIGKLSDAAAKLGGLGGVAGQLGGLAGQIGTIGGIVGAVGSAGSVGGLVGQVSGQLSGLIGQVSNIGSGGVAGVAGQLSNIGGQLSSLGGLAGALGGLGGLAGALGGAGGTIARTAGIVGTLGSVASQLGSLPAIASQINNATSLSSLARGIGSGIGVVTGVVGLVAGLFGGSGGSIYRGVKRPQGSTNTVDRITVDSAIQAILGNAKITSPSFNQRSTQVLSGLNALKALSGVANMQLRLTGKPSGLQLTTVPT
jgi:hypothetical protein